jgi:hypothetical protein
MAPSLCRNARTGGHPVGISDDSSIAFRSTTLLVLDFQPILHRLVLRRTDGIKACELQLAYCTVKYLVLRTRADLLLQIETKRPTIFTVTMQLSPLP